MTRDTPGHRLRAARELRALLRGLGAAAGRPPGGADSVLRGLRGILPYDCAALATWDPVACHHATVAASGYPDAAIGFLDRGMHQDPLFAAIRPGDRPLRVSDIPPPRRRGVVFEAVIGPLGFSDGVTQRLFARDGRYLGMLNASTVDGRHPDDDAVTLLDLLADDLADVLDPVPTPTAACRALADGSADGLLVTRQAVAPLSPGARPDLVHPRSPLRPLVEEVLAGDVPAARALVLLGTDLLHVTLDGGPAGVVVVHHPSAAPFSLTPRELQVLDAVSRGHTNAQTAQALRIAPRTIATHVEHLLSKTGSPNRAAAARLAARLGLLT
jgi:DNA-binding CsgD family transcriptional regulator